MRVCTVMQSFMERTTCENILGCVAVRSGLYYTGMKTKYTLDSTTTRMRSHHKSARRSWMVASNGLTIQPKSPTSFPSSTLYVGVYGGKRR